MKPDMYDVTADHGHLVFVSTLRALKKSSKLCILQNSSPSKQTLELSDSIDDISNVVSNIGERI